MAKTLCVPLRRAYRAGSGSVGLEWRTGSRSDTMRASGGRAARGRPDLRRIGRVAGPLPGKPFNRESAAQEDQDLRAS
jgi:hypothetical protein